jgi:hypothetical protein
VSVALRPGRKKTTAGNSMNEENTASPRTRVKVARGGQYLSRQGASTALMRARIRANLAAGPLLLHLPPQHGERNRMNQLVHV